MLNETKSSAPAIPIPPLNSMEGWPLVSEEIEDVNKSLLDYLLKRRRKLIAALGLFSVVWLFIFWLYWTSTSHNAGSTFFYALFAPFVIWSIVIAKTKSELKAQFYKQFAKNNNLNYLSKGHFNLLGAVCQFGHSKNQNNIITGTVSDHEIILLNQSYTIGHGRGTRHFEKTIFMIDFHHELPPLALSVDKHKYSFGGNIAANIKHKEKVNLEGNTDDFFDLHVEKKFGIEALQIFTPNFTEKIRDNWQQFSLEFLEDQIFIYSNKVITTKTELAKMFELVKYLISALPPVLERMSGSLKAMHDLKK
jgi:hypothetical protein